MSRTIKSKLSTHRREMKFRAHRGKRTKGSRKTRKQIPDDWNLSDISPKFRDRKEFENKYSKQFTEKEAEEWRADR